MAKEEAKKSLQGRRGLLWLCALFCVGIALYVVYPVLWPTSLPTLQSTSTVDLTDWPRAHPAYPFVNYLAQQQILRIQPGKNFKPDEAITRAELALLLSRARELREQPARFPRFKDVGRDNPARGAIEAVAWAGIMTGYPDRIFRPEEPVTRAELAQLAFSLSDSKLTSIDLPPGIEDVPDNHPQRDYIAGALDAEFMTLAVPGCFKPEADATNAEAVRAIAVMMTISPEKREVPLNGILVPIEGKTLMKTLGHKEIEVKSNITVSNNTTIRVGPASEAELRFPDGSGFKLAANSEMTIKAARGRATIRRDGSPGTAIEYLELNLPQGKSFGALASTNSYPGSTTADNQSEKGKLSSKDNSARTVSRGSRAVNNAQTSKTKAQSKDTDNEVPWWREAEKKKVKVKVDMPWGVSAIRGTFWLNTVTPEGQSTSVLIGKTEFTGAGVSQEIAPGYSSTIPARGQAPGKPNPFNTREIKEWKAAQAWVLERARAIQENSPLVDSAMLAIKPPPGISAAPELVQPPLPPVVDEVTRAMYEAMTAAKTREGGVVPDHTAPFVSSTDPTGGTPNVPLDKTIKVSFRENVVPGPNYSRIKFMAGEQQMPASFRIDGSVIRLLSATNLSYNQHYTIEIPPGAVQDTAGNQIKEPYSFSFSTPQPWQVEDVVTGGTIASKQALALDAAGNVHICFYDSETRQMKYVHQTTGGWLVETPAQPGSETWNPGMVLDRAGMPHMVFVDVQGSGDFTLQHVWKNASGWQQEEVARDVNTSTPSLAIDDSGRIHMLYSDKYGLIYACKDGSKWHSEYIDKMDREILLLQIDSSIAIDRQGQPHVTYCKYLIEVATTQSLSYAWRDSSGWHREKIDGGLESNSVGKKNSLDLDDQGNPHVAYYKGNERLGYAWRESGIWHMEMPEPDISGFFFTTSIKLDKAGNPHINYDKRYITKDSQGWHNEEIGGAGSMVLDNKGYAWVAFNVEGNLKIARHCPQGDIYSPELFLANPEAGETGVDCARVLQVRFNENVEPGSNFDGIVLKNEQGLIEADCRLKGNPVVLTIIPRGELRPAEKHTIIIPTGAVQDSSGNPNTTAYNIDFSTVRNWQKDEICPGTITYTAMTLDDSGYAHVSARLNDSLGYICQSPEGLKSEVVDRDSDVQYTAIALDKTGSPCIAYYDQRTHNLLYATQKDTTWFIEKIASLKYCEGIQLVMDIKGAPHIVYEGVKNNGWQRFIGYIYWDSSGWHMETVDEEGDAPAFVLDNSGNPAIAYEQVGTTFTGAYANKQRTLFYAWRDQAGWHREEVAPLRKANFLRSETGLALDSSGQVYIIYNDQGLQYFIRGAGGWRAETLYQNEANDISLARDATGSSHVAFRDWDNETINYLTNSGGAWSRETLTSGYKEGSQEDRWTVESTLQVDRSGVSHLLIAKEASENFSGGSSSHMLGLYHLWLAPLITNTAPQVLNSNLADGQNTVEASSDVCLRFDQNIWPGSAFQEIRLQTGSGSVPVKCSARGELLVIDPVDNLPPGENCTLTLPTGAVENYSGKTLAVEYSMSFTSTRSWQVETLVDSEKLGCWQVNLCLDAGDISHVVYDDFFNKKLIYMKRDDSGWCNQKVAYSAGMNHAIAVDREGYPHIICDASQKQNSAFTYTIQYSWQDRAGWHSENLPVSSRGARGDGALKIVLDNSGWPHITFCLFEEILYYAWKDKSGWHVEILEQLPEDSFSYNASLALDKYGQPVILYSYKDKKDINQLYLTRREADGWQRQQLANLYNIFSICHDLQVDASGGIHLVYKGMGNKLVYGCLQSEEYREETVEQTDSNIRNCLLRFDAGGNPEIIYCTADVIKRAYWTPGDWRIAALASTDGIGVEALAIDSAGNTHVAWEDSDNDDIKYATLDVNGVGIGGTYPAAGANGVAVDQLVELVYNKDISGGPAIEQVVLLQAGQAVPVQQVVQGRKLILVPLQELLPGASYRVKLPAGAVRSKAGTLSPAYDFSFTTVNSSWQHQTIDSGGDVGRYASAAADAAGNVRISYYDNSNHTLKYAVRNKAGWQTETADQAGDVGSYSSLAVDARGISHISYYDATCKALKYAVRNKFGWQTEIVDRSGDVGSYSALAINGGRIASSYYDASQAAIKYAEKINNSWLIETVTRGSAGGHTALFLDSDGNPHIAYYTVGSGDLQYAVRDSTGWQVETVDSQGDAGYYPSLVLNGSGQPCISYYEAGQGVLKYAVKQAGKWQIETVDSSKQAGFYTALKLDGAGQPCISYYDSRGYDLKYAVKKSGSWQVETVSARGMVGAYSSLILDQTGRPLIFYYDGTSQDLKCSQGQR